MSVFKPVITAQSLLNSVTQTDGQFIFVSDRGELHIDTEDGRVKVSDVITGTYDSITSDFAPLVNKVYFATDTHQLLQAVYNSDGIEWHELNPLQAATTSTLGGVKVDGTTITISNGVITAASSDVTNIVELSGSTISQAVANNTIYNCTSGVTSMTLMADDNLIYATVNFTTGANPVFRMPASGWKCTGSDCVDSAFSPQSNSQYRLVIENDGSEVIVSVYRVGERNGAESVDWSDITNKPDIPTAYVLPEASTSVLGGVMVDGSTITADADGTIHASVTVDSVLDLSSTNAIQNAVVTAEFNKKASTSHTHSYSEITDAPAAYTLPTATSSTLGGVKIDNDTIVIDKDGAISAVGDLSLKLDKNQGSSNAGKYLTIDDDGYIVADDIESYTLPTASTSTLGGVKVDGSTVTIDANGVISASSSGALQFPASYAGRLLVIGNDGSVTVSETQLYSGTTELPEYNGEVE